MLAYFTQATGVRIPEPNPNCGRVSAPQPGYSRHACEIATITAHTRSSKSGFGLVDEIDLVVAGGIRNGADVAKCLALGAKAVAIGHSALIWKTST